MMTLAQSMPLIKEAREHGFDAEWRGDHVVVVISTQEHPEPVERRIHNRSEYLKVLLEGAAYLA